MSVLGDLWVKLGLKKEGFDSGMKDAEKRTQSFGGKVKSMGAGMKAAWAAVAAVVASKAAQIATDLVETAAKAEGIKTAFAKIADGKVLDELREATRGTVTDVQLMQRTIQASNFGIPIEQLATYFKFATERAIQTGESVDYLVDSIVTGLGRKSVMILDNLGISAAQIREEMGKGGDMAAAVGAIIQREMEKSGNVASTTAVTIQQTRAAWENLKVSVGNSQVIQKTLTTLAEAATSLVKSLDQVAKAGGVAAYNMSSTVAEELEYLRAEGMSDGQLADMIRKKMGQYEQNGKGYMMPLTSQTDLSGAFSARSYKKEQQYYEALADALKGLETEQNKVNTSVQEYNNLTEKQEQMVTGAIAILENNIKALQQKRDTLAGIDEIAAANTQIEGLQDELELLKSVNAEYLEQMDLLRSKEAQLQKVASAAALGAKAETGDSSLSGGYGDWLQEQTEKGQAASEAFAVQMDAIGQAADVLNNGLKTGLLNGLDYLFSTIEGTEDFDLGTMMQTLLGPLADAAIEAGIIIMGVGDGLTALQSALRSMNPYVAIAAGAALVAIGVAAKAGLAAIANGSSSSGSTSQGNYSWSGGYSTSSVAAAESSSSIDVNVTGKISGQDIVLATEKYYNNKKR